MPEPESKAQQRQRCLAARRALSKTQRNIYSEAVCRALLQRPELRRAGTVLSYLAAWDEVDLSLLHDALRAMGKRLCFPCVTGEGTMEAFEPEPGAIEPGPFGVRAPIPGRSRMVSPEEIDLVLCPCLGFDRQGGRLGHGGGYYDRYLARCGQADRILAAFSCQELPRVRQEAHDRPVPVIVTENLQIG